MAPICDCGEDVPTDEDVARCATDNHRRALIRQAREALEATPAGDRDDGFWEAMAELDLLEQQTPPRPPDAEEVIDLIGALEKGAQALVDATGRRPTTMLLGTEMAGQVRRVSTVFPAVFGTRRMAPHERPASFPRSKNWLGQLAGIDLFEQEVGHHEQR